MEQVMWHTVEAAERGLAEIELRISGGEFFDAYLQQLQCNGQAQCTTIWTKTTTAYRCFACQVNDSSAICVSCFTAGDHRHHEYVMYQSDSGGCCDCGDPAAWKEEGFCKNHSSHQPKNEAMIPSHLKEVTSQAVQFVLRELSLWMEIIAEARNSERVPSSYSLEVQMAQTYLLWLRKVCSVTAFRAILCEEILRIRTGGTTSTCFLDKLLSTYARMPEALMEAATTLFLQMLYDPQFKDRFSRALMRHYGSMILPAVVIPGFLPDFKILSQSLDRVMVQLFNVPETTLNLIQTDHLLEVVVSVLDSIVRHCINKDTGTVNVNHPAIIKKVYIRPQGDLMLILAHEAVSLHVLKERPDVFKSILSIGSMLQWMDPCTRSESVDADKQMSWTQAITLEINTIQVGFRLIGQCFSAFAASGDVSRSALVSAACLTMASLREFLTKVKVSQGSQDTVSLHIPLHRTLCAIISKLVLMPWEESRDGFLSNLQPPFEENEVVALMDHPLRVTVWMAQIRAQMWRNSPEGFARLDMIYSGSIWHAQSMDMDIFMLQICSVARENMEESVVLTIAKRFDLVDMVTMPTDLGAQNRLLSPKKVSMIQDFLRLMLLIVRERRNTGMSEKESLRSDVIQWLCVKDMTYSQLSFTLSGIVVDQSKLNRVLEEVAIYNDPKLQERGFYQLKPECWKEFDPLFAHFYLNDLEEAQERALSVGKLSHYWRLQPPSDAKPPFNRLIKLLHTQACRQLVWNVLHSVTVLIRDEVTATSAEALGVMTLQLLGMALTDIRELASNLHESSMTSQRFQMKSSSLHPSNNSLDFIYSKPSINHGGGTVVFDNQDSSGTYRSIFEMLSDLRKVKESFRLVDMVDHVLQLLSSSSVTDSGFESTSLQGSDAYMDDEQRKLKKQRQEAILATFAARQKAFLEKTVDGDDSNRIQVVALLPKDNDIARSTSRVNESPLETVLEETRPAGSAGHESDHHECAFCRSECDGKESPTGWIAWVQRYNLPSLIHRRGQLLNHVEEVSSLLDTEYEHDGIWFSDMISVVSATSEKDLSSAGSLDLHPTEHVRCCGHQMHQICFQRYAESLLKRHYAKSPYEGKGLIDLGRMDFLCPICRRLANVLLPDVNQVIPWNRLCTKEEQAIRGVLPRQDNELDEGLTFFNLNSLLPAGSTDLNDVQYWDQYWYTHENLAEAIALFVSQCLRVRNAFLKEPPELEGLPLCQILWETFAENIVHCEVETREGPTVKDVASSSRSSEDALLWSGDAAHRRALTELGKLALLTNTMPCAAAKHEKRLLLLQWIGFDESIVNKFKDDIGLTFMNPPQVSKAVRQSDGQQDQGNQLKSVCSADDEALPSIAKGRSNQKSIEQPRFTYAADGGWQETRQDQFSRKFEKLKNRGGDMAVGLGGGETFEVGDATNIGWLWNNTKSLSSGAVESSDPFEILIMLLVTFEGWPSFQDVMTMVRVTYVVAATQASVAFDQLNRDVDDDILSLSSLKDKVMQVACLPFLRRAALLVEIVTENTLQCRKGRQEFLSMDSSFLQRLLNLPSVHDAAKLGLQGKHEMSVRRQSKGTEVVPYLYKTPRQALLVKLPEVFQELVLQNLTVACLNCGLVPHEPAICLVCGNLFCCGTKCCNIDGLGECYRHADKESAGLGLYLLMRSTKLVLLRNNRMCIAPSLYLDRHGEEDAYLRRGLPLHLSHLRLNEIKRLWLTAAFDHDTHILHESSIGGNIL